MARISDRPCSLGGLGEAAGLPRGFRVGLGTEPTNPIRLVLILALAGEGAAPAVPREKAPTPAGSPPARAPSLGQTHEARRRAVK